MQVKKITIVMCVLFLSITAIVVGYKINTTALKEEYTDKDSLQSRQMCQRLNTKINEYLGSDVSNITINHDASVVVEITLNAHMEITEEQKEKIKKIVGKSMKLESESIDINISSQ